jgi:tetratricopeptide (TPR) repeat protein
MNRSLEKQTSLEIKPDARLRKPGAKGSSPFQAPMKGGSDNRRMVFGICIFLAAITWLVFGQAFRYEFVNYDDEVYITDNAAIRDGLSLKGIVWAFTHNVNLNWTPLAVISHMLDCQFYGTKAGWHHLTSILLHIATVIALFLVLKRLTGALWRSAFVAAVFAIHPLHVESVAWVAERRDVLCGLFFMLTIGAYARHVRKKSESNPALASGLWSWSYGLVLFLFALALLSKPMAVTLPFVLLLLDYWPLQRISGSGGRFVSWPLIAEKIPLLALCAAACLTTLFAQQETITSLPLPVRIGNALVSYVAYLGQMIYPVGLSIHYPHPGSGLAFWKIVAATILLLSISAAAVANWRKRPWFLVGWFWYLGMLVPVIGIVQVGSQARADRYTYLPQIGLYLLLAWAVSESCAGWRHRRVVLGSLSAIISSVLIFCAHAQTSYWRNSETLWMHALDCTSDNAVAHSALGNALLEEGRADEAILHCQKALQLIPDYVDAHNDLGCALLEKERVDEAIEQFQKALQMELDQKAVRKNSGYGLLHKGSAAAENNLGNALLKKGRGDEAIAHFQKSLQTNPDYAEVHVNLGNALLQKEQLDEALIHFRKALELAPADPEVHFSLGNALFQNKKVDEAIVHFRKALELKPHYSPVYNNLGNALLLNGRVDEAITCFQNGLKLKPNDLETHYNFAAALMQKGNAEEAIPHYQKVLEINPEFTEAHFNLGNALLQKGKVDEAIDHYQKVLLSKPDLAEAHNNLGNALMQKGNVEEAIGSYKRVVQLKPEFVDAYNNLGNALLQKGNAEEAIAYFQKALELKPDDTGAQNNLAWVLATSPQASLRNGNKAVELAERANQRTGGENPNFLETLATAYAEAGRFNDAMQIARKAKKLALTTGQQSLVAQLEIESKLYEAGRPFHEAAK